MPTLENSAFGGNLGGLDSVVGCHDHRPATFHGILNELIGNGHASVIQGVIGFIQQQEFGLSQNGLGER